MKKIIALGGLMLLLSGCSLITSKNEDVRLKQNKEASINSIVNEVTEKTIEKTKEGWLLYNNEHMSFTMEYSEELEIIEEKDVQIKEDAEMGVTFRSKEHKEGTFPIGVYITVEEDELPKKEDGDIFTLAEYKNMVDNLERQENSTYQSEYLNINGYSFFFHTQYSDSDIWAVFYEDYHVMINKRYYWFRFALGMEEFSLKQIEQQKVINREMVNSFKLK